MEFVAQVVVVNGQKVVDFEARLNQVLADINAEDLLSIDYVLDPNTYGMIAFVRYKLPAG